MFKQEQIKIDRKLWPFNVMWCDDGLGRNSKSKNSKAAHSFFWEFPFFLTEIPVWAVIRLFTGAAWTKLRRVRRGPETRPLFSTTLCFSKKKTSEPRRGRGASFIWMQQAFLFLPFLTFYTLCGFVLFSCLFWSSFFLLLCLLLFGNAGVNPYFLGQVKGHRLAQILTPDTHTARVQRVK